MNTAKTISLPPLSTELMHTQVPVKKSCMKGFGSSGEGPGILVSNGFKKRTHNKVYQGVNVNQMFYTSKVVPIWQFDIQ